MTVNDTGAQVDSPGGGWEDDSTDAPELDPAEVDDDTADDDEDEDAEDQGGRRPNRESNLRRRAQAAEAERDQLRDQLDATRQSIVDDIAQAIRLDPRLLVAGGHEVADFVNEEGHLDRAAVITAFREVARDFGVHRGIAPNAAQGHHLGGLTGRKSVGDTINEALGR